MSKKIENTYEIMIDGMTKNSEYYVGRSYMDTPEIDGIVYVKNTKKLRSGEFTNCKITDIKDYDLIGEIV